MKKRMAWAIQSASGDWYFGNEGGWRHNPLTQEQLRRTDLAPGAHLVRIAHYR